MTERILPVIVSDAQLLDMQETCTFLRASRATIYRYMREEGLRPVQAGGKLLFQVGDLKSWIEAHKVKAAA